MPLKMWRQSRRHRDQRRQRRHQRIQIGPRKGTSTHEMPNVIVYPLSNLGSTVNPATQKLIVSKLSNLTGSFFVVLTLL